MTKYTEQPYDRGTTITVLLRGRKLSFPVPDDVLNDQMRTGQSRAEALDYLVSLRVGAERGDAP